MVLVPEQPRIYGGPQRAISSPDYGTRTQPAVAGPTIFLNAVVALDPQTSTMSAGGSVVQTGRQPGSIHLGPAPIVDDLNSICARAGANVVITYHWGRPDAEMELRSAGMRGPFHWDRFSAGSTDLEAAIESWLAQRGRPPFVVIDRQIPDRVRRGMWVAVQRDQRLGAELVNRLVTHLTSADAAKG